MPVSDMELEELPSVLFFSSTEKDPCDVIRLLEEEMAPPTQYEPGLLGYPWHLDTKYYNANICLLSLKEKLALSERWVDSIQGVVAFFNPDSTQGIVELEEWMVLLNHLDLEVKILLCSLCKEDNPGGLGRVAVQEWCLRKGFELVELEGEVENEDYAEKVGIARVKQALEAHPWSNLVLKERRQPTAISDLLNGGRLNSQSPDVGVGMANPFEEEDMLFERSLDEILGDVDSTDFADLFSRLASIKERASALPSNERKQLAEKVVKAYWQCIGGDSDEISSDEEIA